MDRETWTKSQPKGGAVEQGADENPPGEGPLEIPLSEQQLRAFQYGVGAMIVPVGDEWKVVYFGAEEFEDEVGEMYPSFEDAMAAIEEIIPAINTPDQREKMRDMAEILRLREELRRRKDE